MSPVRAFVAGATGLTGRHVVACLRALGHETVAHVRPTTARLREWQARFSALGARVDASPWEPAAIAGALATAEPTILLSLLGTTQARIRDAKARGDAEAALGYAEVDVGMTKMLLDGALRLSPRPRLVYLSSTGAGTPGKGAYLDARTEVEEAIRRSGVPYTIARPSFIVGERDDSRALEKAFVPVAGVALGLVRALGGRRIADRYAAITGEALASSLVRLGLDPAWENRIAEREDLG